MKSYALLLLILVLLLSVSATMAQTHRATVRGQVTNAPGESLAGAQVRLIQTGTNETRDLKTGAQGEFIISQLAPGPYRLEVESSVY